MSAENNINDTKTGEVEMIEQQKETTTPKLILVTDWNKYFEYPTLGALRALIFNADKNGFNKVTRRIQSRVLIHVEAFYNWVEEINGMA